MRTQLKFRPPTDLLNSSEPHSPYVTSPSLDVVSEDEDTDTGYFDKPSYPPTPRISDSANASDHEYESDYSVDSDATLDDSADIFSNFGHPLERMADPRIHDSNDTELAYDSDPEFGHGVIYHPGSPCSSCCSSTTHSLSSLTSSFMCVIF
jgi:hypothetical protein